MQMPEFLFFAPLDGVLSRRLENVGLVGVPFWCQVDELFQKRGAQQPCALLEVGAQAGLATLITPRLLARVDGQQPAAVLDSLLFWRVFLGRHPYLLVHETLVHLLAGQHNADLWANDLRAGIHRGANGHEFLHACAAAGFGEDAREELRVVKSGEARFS